MDNAKLRRDKDERDRPASVVLHQDLEALGSRDCDRGSIRVFEAQLACQPYGDWISGSRAAQKAVGKFIIDVAKDNGLFFAEDSLPILGERKKLPSGESIIYENPAQGVVYKVRDPFAKLHLKSSSALDVIYEHIAHNVLFPETAYNFIGVSSLLDEVRLIYSQRFVFSCGMPSESQIEQYLAQKGLLKEDEYYYGNEFVAVTDVSATSDNVILTDNGDLAFIDPIIKIRKPVDEIIGYYNSVATNIGSKSTSVGNQRSLFDKLKSWFQKQR